MSEKYIGIDLGSEFLKIAVHENNRICGEISERIPEQLRMDGRMQQCFIVPWMNPADINRTPAWVNETIWYQIFPDRFCNGTPEKNGDDITPWRNHGTVTNEEKFGGNLEGIRQRLSYLQELGITGIYLNPIMKAESNHKYDTTDYTKIDPSFGDGGPGHRQGSP